MKKITYSFTFVSFFLLFNLHSSSQPKCEWAQKIACSYTTPVTCVEIDKLGNIYIGGWYFSSTVEFNNGISLENLSDYDAFIAKYNSEGICQWAERIYGNYDVFILSLEVDNNNNVYLAGQSLSSILYFNNGISLTSNSYQQGFLAKYNSEGICQWAQFVADDSSVTTAFKIKVDSDGNLILAGEFYESTIHFNNNISLNVNGQNNAYIAKYNSDGICQWAERIGGTNIDYTWYLAVENLESGNKKN